jgi:hypothetical protein
MELLSIGEAARILRVHTDTLKRWEDAGKVRPRRDHRGTRFYTARDIERLRRWREPRAVPSGGRRRDGSAKRRAGERASAVAVRNGHVPQAVVAGSVNGGNGVTRRTRP